MLTTLKNILQRSIFKELSWYTSAQIIVQLMSFISVIIIARYLGPSNLGLYSFIQNYGGALLTVVGGMDFYFMWKIARSSAYSKDLEEYIGHKFNIYIILSIVGIGSAWLVLPRDISIMVTILLLPVFIQSLNSFSYYVIAINRAKLMSIVQMSSAIILFLLKVLLVYYKASLYAFVVISALDLIMTGLILTFYFVRFPEWRKFFYTFKFQSFKSSFVFLYSIRLSILAIIFWQFLLRADQLILATISNAYTLGIYSAAVKISEVPNFLAGVLSSALVSRMAYISVKHDNTSQEKLNKLMLYYLFVGSIITIGIIILAPLAVHILYGQKFNDSIPVLKVYALSIPGMFMNYFFLGIYGAKEKQLQQVAIFGLALVLNIVLIYVLTPVFGLKGTALATALAYTISAFGFYINLKK
jgi:O-antigen/teichoic acid export membrane protein